MGDKSKIDWTDATLFKRVRPLRWEKTGMIEQRPADQHIRWNAPLLFQPIPYVLGSLGTIAGGAGRNDVAEFAKASFLHRDDMIPGGRRLRAIGAKTVEFLKDHLLRVKRNRRDPALPGLGMLAAFGAECLTLGVMGAGVFVRMVPTKAVLSEGRPVSTATAPAQSVSAHFNSFGAMRLRAITNRFAFAANIGPAVKARSINIEQEKRLLLLTLRAGLFAFCPATDEAPVCFADIFGAMSHV